MKKLLGLLLPKSNGVRPTTGASEASTLGLQAANRHDAPARSRGSATLASVEATAALGLLTPGLQGNGTPPLLRSDDLTADYIDQAMSLTAGVSPSDADMKLVDLSNLDLTNLMSIETAAATPHGAGQQADLVDLSLKELMSLEVGAPVRVAEAPDPGLTEIDLKDLLRVETAPTDDALRDLLRVEATQTNDDVKDLLRLEAEPTGEPDNIGLTALDLEQLMALETASAPTDDELAKIDLASLDLGQLMTLDGSSPTSENDTSDSSGPGGPVEPVVGDTLSGSFGDTTLTGGTTGDTTVTGGTTTSDTSTATATAPAANNTPVAATDTGTTGEDAALILDVLANDGDPDASDTLSISGAAITAGAGTVSVVGDKLVYDPAGTYDSLAVGETATVTVEYTIDDGNGGTATATATITITGTNDGPVANPDNVTAGFETAVTFDPLLNDSDPDASDVLTVTSVTQGANGTVVLNPDGTVTYTPDDAFTGTDTFTYTVSDGQGGNSTTTVSVNVADGVFLSGTNGDDILIGTAGNDELRGRGGIDELYGLAGNDTLIGGTESDLLYGGDGDDSLAGGPGDDLLVGGAGADFLDGNAGVDTLSYAGSSAGVTVDLLSGTGSGGDAEGDVIKLLSIVNVIGSDFDDVLTGDDGNNSLEGGAGNDLLFGGLGSDTLIGGAGDDTIEWDSADAMIDGSAGTDVLSVSSGDIDLTAFAGVMTGVDVVDLASDPAASHLTLTFAEIIAMSDSGVMTILGGAGDSIDAGAGWTDAGFDGSGNHIYTQDDGINTATLIIAPDVSISFTPANTRPVTTADAAATTTDMAVIIDVLANDTDPDASDILTVVSVTQGANGTVAINPDGSLTYTPGGGFTGTDTFTYTIDDGNGGTATETVTVHVSAGGVNLVGTVGNDTLTGGAGDDTLDGKQGDDVLIGLGGADTLIGSAGNDTADYSLSGAGVTVDIQLGTGSGGDAEGDILTDMENIIGSDFGDFLTGTDTDNILEGAAGDDILVGGGGADTVLGGMGDDTLTGDGGADVLVGGAGADSLDGGSNSDTADYTGSSAGVKVDLTAGLGAGGDAQGDTLINIENVIGSDFDDSLAGDAGANVLEGGSGNDILDGGGWHDTLVGGLGSDTLTGGTGNDTFVLALGTGSDTDTIVDFTQGEDKIDVTALSPADFLGLTIVDDGAGNTVITAASGDSLVLLSVDAATLTLSDFIV